MSSPTFPGLPRADRIRHRSHCPARFSRRGLQYAPLADGLVAVPGEQPRRSLPYQLLVDHGVTNLDERDGSAVAVNRHEIDLDQLGGDEDRGDVFGLGPEVLFFSGQSIPERRIFSACPLCRTVDGLHRSR